MSVAKIDSISPSQGPIAGGIQVTLTGSGFAGATLAIDGTTVTSQSSSNTQMVFVTPPRDNGIASISLSGNGPNAYTEFLYLPPPLKDLPPGYVTTVMGIGVFRGDGRPATKATVDTEEPGFTILSDGSLVFSEPNEFAIRHVRSDGVIERYAGTGVGGPSGDGGPALKAVLSHPRGVATDAAGNVFIADAGGFNCIRRIDATTGIISTVYGKQSAFGFSGDGGPASDAKFNSPLQIAFDGEGNLYVLDSGNGRIRKIDTNGIITTIAGTGVAGYSGDGGPATQATFNDGGGDGGLAADSQGNVYLADTGNHAVRKIDGHTGIITTFIANVTEVVAVIIDPVDNVYVGNKIVDSTSNRILKLSPSGQILQSWGKGNAFSEDGATAATASFCQITRVALDHSGNILFGENCSSRIRRINVATGLLETLAGMGPNIIGETGPLLETVLNDPGTDLLFLPNGDLLTAEDSNNLIRKVDLNGNVQKFAGSGFRINFPNGQGGLPALRSAVSPVGLGSAPNGDILIANIGGIVRIDGAGITHGITDFSYGFSGDGQLANPFGVLQQPWDVTADSAGNIFIADTNNNRIRRIDAGTGIISTVAGSGPVNGGEGYGHGGYCGDGGPATAACLNTPYGVAVAPDGTMYISENFERIRKVTPDGIITTFFSSSFVGGGNKVRQSSTSNLFIMPFRIEPNGHPFQLAFSNQTHLGIGDGGPASRAGFDGFLQDSGIAVDSEGNLFFADPVGRRIRAIRFGAVMAEPGSTINVVAGGSQTTTTETKFSVPFEVTLMSPANTPENGIRVDFSTTDAGASCKFPNGASTYSVLTDINGHASTVCTANANAGSYNVTATPLTLTQSVSFSLTNSAPTSSPLPIAVNISTRDTVGTANGVMIGGFIIQGSESKSVMIRAIGPTLSRFGVTNALSDPTLELHGSSGATIATNDNWVATQHGGVITADQVTNIRNSGLAPSQPYEAAMIVQLEPGAYTAIVGGVKGTAGIGLVEVYDLDSNVNSRLANISTRGSVDTGDNVMIGGFIVQGDQPKKMVIRAIGPSLKQFGINNALSDPTLELHDSSDAVIATNNNWQTTQILGVITADQANDIKNSGLAPTDPLEAAVIVTLPPANYTAIVRGVNGTGIGLVEVYALQ